MSTNFCKTMKSNINENTIKHFTSIHGKIGSMEINDFTVCQNDCSHLDKIMFYNNVISFDIAIFEEIN